MSPVGRAMGTLERFDAVLGFPDLYLIGQELQHEQRVGRPSDHPPYVLLIFAVLGRLTRSTVRVETDLSDPRTWQRVRDRMLATITTYGLDVPPPGPRPPAWHHWRRWRDGYLATDEGLARLAAAVTPRAVEMAHSLGLLLPDGPGSWTHPDPSRALYGDGTVIRPIYAPPVALRTSLPDGTVEVTYPDPTTGELLDHPPGRYDPDIASYHGQSGPVLGHAYVTFQVRGPRHYQRVILGAAHVPAPGQEATTALALLRDLYRDVGQGAQIVVYDGAFRGVHIDDIMTRCGWLVIAPTHKRDPGEPDLDRSPTAIRLPDGKLARAVMIGTATHDTPLGPCSHALAAVNGALVQVDLDETGDPVVSGRPTRHAVKRARRSDGTFHFNIAYVLECERGTHVIWLSPHAHPDHGNRSEHLRVIPEHDPDWVRIRGIRSDAEGTWSQYKRTLIADRSMSLGWRRGHIDMWAFALLNNAYAHHRHLRAADVPVGRRHLRP